jgi:hypothetical protein
LAERPVRRESVKGLGAAAGSCLRRLHSHGDEVRDEIGVRTMSAGAQIRLCRRGTMPLRRKRDESVFHRDRLRLLSQNGTLPDFRSQRRKQRADVAYAYEVWLGGNFPKLFKIRR